MTVGDYAHFKRHVNLHHLEFNQAFDWTTVQRFDPGFFPLLIHALGEKSSEWLSNHPRLLKLSLSYITTQTQNKILQLARPLLGKLKEVSSFFRLRTPLNSLLLESVTNGNRDLLIYALNQGASVCAVDAQGRSALQLACLSNQESLALILVEAGSYLEKSLNETRDRPLHLAVQAGMKRLLKKLIDSGVNLDAKNAQGETALHLAVSDERKEIALMLLEAGAAVDAKTDRGVTPLMIAALTGQHMLARELLLYGADPRECDLNGYSPLKTDLNTLFLICCKSGDEEVVRLLIAFGIEAATLCIKGVTVFSATLFNGHFKYAHLFPSNVWDRDFLEYKLLGSFLSLKGRVQLEGAEMSLEGSFSPLFYGQIGALLNAFPLEQFPGLTQQSKMQLVEAFHHASVSRSPQELYAQALKKKILIAHGGCVGHAIGLMIFKMGEIAYLAISNRGKGVDHSSQTLQVFQIDSSKLSVEIFEAIRSISNEERDTKKFVQFYYQKLPGLLSPSPSNQPVKDWMCMQFETIGLSMQKTGNCSLSSGIGLVRLGAAFFAHEKNELSPLELPLEVVRFSKAWSIWAKWQIYQRFVHYELQKPIEKRQNGLILLASQEISRKLKKRRAILPR